MRPLTLRNLVRGQCAGYRREPQVARTSDDVETIAARGHWHNPTADGTTE
jgi:hypothetical protein